MKVPRSQIYELDSNNNFIQCEFGKIENDEFITIDKNFDNSYIEENAKEFNENKKTIEKNKNLILKIFNSENYDVIILNTEINDMCFIVLLYEKNYYYVILMKNFYLMPKNDVEFKKKMTYEIMKFELIDQKVYENNIDKMFYMNPYFVFDFKYDQDTIKKVHSKLTNDGKIPTLIKNFYKWFKHCLNIKDFSDFVKNTDKGKIIEFKSMQYKECIYSDQITTKQYTSIFREMETNENITINQIPRYYYISTDWKYLILVMIDILKMNNSSKRFLFWVIWIETLKNEKIWDDY